jgi:hypothetical protein
MAEKTFKIVKTAQEYQENPVKPMDSILKRETVQTGLTFAQAKEYRKNHKGENLEIVPE